MFESELRDIIDLYLLDPNPHVLAVTLAYITQHRDNIEFGEIVRKHTMLTWCARHNNIELVRMLIQEGFSSIHEHTLNTFSDTAMLWFAFNGNMEACEFLRLHGGNINDTDTYDGKSACMWAINKHKDPCVLWFLSRHELNVEYKDVHGRGILWHLCNTRQYEYSCSVDALLVQAIARGVRDPVLLRDLKERDSPLYEKLYKLLVAQSSIRLNNYDYTGTLRLDRKGILKYLL
jgi:hypothetical protein